MAFENEETLIGAVLHGQHDWYQAAIDRSLEPEHFSTPDHQFIWRAIVHAVASKGRWGIKARVATDCAQAGVAIEACRALSDRGACFQVEDYHVEQVLTDFWRMEVAGLLSSASAATGRAENLASLQEKCRQAASSLDSLSSGLKIVRQDNSFLPVYQRTIDAIERQWDDVKAGRQPWITSGLAKLDSHLGGGFQSPGAYTFVAMSGRGKTHIGIHLALEAAKAGAGVVYFTVEMPQAQIMRRMIANTSNVSSTKLTSLALSADDFDRMQTIPEAHGKLNLAIEDSFGADVDRLKTLIRNYKRAGKLDFAVVDYIQQLTTSKRCANKQQEMMHVTHELKQTCIDEGIVLIQLAQANRQAEASEKLGERLHAGHLEHSHAIYENSDAVIFFQAETLGSARTELLSIAKNRHGISGTPVQVVLDYEHSRLRSY